MLLFDDMKIKHGVKFISTYKLNQDVLENSFSPKRQTGEVVALSNINQGNDNDNNNIISISSTEDLAQSDQERDGLRYIMGYIAKKYHDKFPDLDLGTQTKNIAEDHSYCQPPTFVRHLSVAGLFEPSSSFVNYGHKMEMIFVKMHPDGILQKKSGI
uniref:Transposable element P transposase-like C-terminal domain-containing protein n=1 Tax=Anopheles quadriannulatus TaxID=34691 RepID=A0A182XPG4_ANOQN